MRIAYLECFSGISGDMFMGALIDAGVPPEVFVRTVEALDVDARLEIKRVDRSGISATKVDVIAAGEKELPREEFWAGALSSQHSAQKHSAVSNQQSVLQHLRHRGTLIQGDRNIPAAMNTHILSHRRGRRCHMSMATATPTRGATITAAPTIMAIHIPIHRRARRFHMSMATRTRIAD